MTGRGRGRSVRAGGRGVTASASPPGRRVTRQQNHNIDPSLSAETAVDIDTSGTDKIKLHEITYTNHLRRPTFCAPYQRGYRLGLGANCVTA